MAIKEKTKRLLLARSGGFCANPGCNINLFPLFENGEITNVEELAHIIGRKIGGPRGDEGLGLDKRDGYKNIIILCPTCHRKIDKFPNLYPTSVIREWKLEHEQKIKNAVNSNFNDKSKSTIKNAERVSRNLNLKRRMKNDLLWTEKELFSKYDADSIRYESWLKFKYHNVLIRSVDDTSFPLVKDDSFHRISSWFKGECWDFYENGLELVRDGVDLIFDKDDNWDILQLDDPRKDNPDYKIRETDTSFYRIPFDYIVDYDMSIDNEYYHIPSIYVTYSNNGTPYEEVLRGWASSVNSKRSTRTLDNSKRKKLE